MKPPLPNQESAETSTGQIDSELLVASSRRSRIHFPADETSSPRQSHRSIDAHSRILPMAFRTSPTQRNSPLNPHGSAGASARRRVRSVGTSEDASFDSPLGRKSYNNNLFTPPRALNPPKTFELAEEDSLGLSLFSDEYDLSHEDPRILQDVQRALKLKARREARSSNKSTSPRPEAISSRAQPKAFMTTQPTQLSTSRKTSVSSDIDFSPSTSTALLHPVPSSLNNGSTLDWSGFEDDKAESRWKLNTSKRKGKEVIPPPLITVVGQQDAAYADKIAQIKVAASTQTLKKAKITQDQLARRYNVLYDLLSRGTPLSPTKVARWHSEQNTFVRNSLQNTEPFTWLKHLERRGNKPERSAWNLSALITEEYIQAQNRQDSMVMIPEDSALFTTSPEIPLLPSLANNHSDSRRSRVSLSSNIPVPSAERKAFLDGGLSFEPRVDSTRTSFDAESRQSDDSSFSNVLTGLPSTTPNSPTSNLLGRREITFRVANKLRNNNSSVEQFLSEESDKGILQGSRPPIIPIPEPKIKIVAAGDESENGVGRIGGITVQLTVPTPLDADPPQSQVGRPSAEQPRPSVRRRVRVSLPPADRTSKSSETNLRLDAYEEKAHEVKARLLEETAAHNHRIRQLLNRVSVGIRELESVQSNAMASLGITHIGLPRELIDAFGHDPAAVTSSTRRYQGWRAVDDIQNRLLRQRKIFRDFLSHADADVSIPKSVLDHPISSLVQSLEALKLHSQKIAKRATEVGEALHAVQTTHGKVKEDYKATLSRTSVVYPELSYIVALEESYKDQYQQFWEFGMDTLTFLLDTVTPFWRTYGKPIGEDMRDFLIVPLYRNEFTGESKRYPISRIPNRSFRHWLGLVVFFFASLSVNILQVRAAASSAAHYKLPMIPYESIRWTVLPFFWVSIIIQWWAVLVESVIVLMQLGVVVWWIGWSIRIFT
ncbi:hypothetical protein H0H81_007445 [Sphagnurus paluster]|uniref:Uncharacterized protein n=1 Tax=Sphagnurus paluster TaxID=117069 RepID=A0A9P7KLZ7_9AGAR|nr:hypothetical protein H0H81_007445 [Sphagnurus paluster]